MKTAPSSGSNSAPNRFARTNTSTTKEKVGRVLVANLRDYCGLPDHAFNPSPLALVYKCRKPLRDDHEEEKREEEVHRHKQGTATAESSHGAKYSASSLSEGVGVGQKGASANAVLAQRKVAQALFTMASNESMASHFIFQGGVEAAMKLIGESKDFIVLTKCAGKCFQVSQV
jgi:hypothetical protein